uniref:RNA helicase n=1 Tax=Gorilla gorilla gorilla TaxID=9595 RepID=A0A2I2YVH9_GORGO
TPSYEIRALGNKSRQKFLCEVQVEGYNYSGIGNSTNKNDAQSNAARDFVNYLFRLFGVASLPPLTDIPDTTANAEGGLPTTMGGPLPPHLALKAENNSEVGASGYGANLKDYYSRKEEQEVQVNLESEEVDLNAGLHGNWTSENAKTHLNQYFQKEKIQGEYEYTQVGPDHNRSFTAEITVYIKQLGRRIFAHEHGSNKKLAAQSCAMSLVRQLYHLGVVEAYFGLTKKEGERVEPYKVNLSLGIVPRSPPQSRWNPWTTSNIAEGPLAFASPEQISLDLKNELVYQLEQDHDLPAILQEQELLPVKKFESEILEAISQNSVVIIRGAAGCGKTTQAECNIVVTQPRRISVVSVAERVAFERGEEPVNSCGYSVQFESVLPCPHASIMFCTVGVLLRKLEAVYGRTYPVQEYFLEDCIQMTHFVPSPKNNKKDKDDDGGEDDDANCNLIRGDEYGPETRMSMSQLNEKETPFELVEALFKYIETLNIPRAVLVFLPGWNLIYTMQKHLEMNPHFGSHQYQILPLHSQIPRQEQRKVFDPVPVGVTEVILSTNIAETSIIINDVVYVIDSCKQKVKLFATHNNMTNYATVWGSKTNPEQRKGRAGRIRPGFCFHLCSRARFERLETHMTPEMFQTPLHEVALSIKLLCLVGIGQFLVKAIETLPLDAVIEAEHTLRELDALDANDDLTPLGRILANLPIEPRFGKMMIMVCIFYVGDAICTIPAATCFPEHFINEGKRLGYNHQNFAGNRFSHHVALLSVFQARDDTRMGGEEAEIRFCAHKRLNMATLRMTWEVKVQLKEILINSGFPEDCLVTQVFTSTGPDNNLDVEKTKILTTEGCNALIHKSSVNCPFSSQDMKYPSPFFVFGEKIRTRAISAKGMTLVTPLQLLLFASKKVQSDGQIVLADDWIKLQISHEAAACITALQAATEALVVEVTKQPAIISQLDPVNESILNMIRQISRPSAADINLMIGSTWYGDGPGPPKMARYDNGSGYRRGGSSYGNEGYGSGYSSGGYRSGGYGGSSSSCQAGYGAGVGGGYREVSQGGYRGNSGGDYRGPSRGYR